MRQNGLIWSPKDSGKLVQAGHRERHDTKIVPETPRASRCLYTEAGEHLHRDAHDSCGDRHRHVGPADAESEWRTDMPADTSGAVNGRGPRRRTEKRQRARGSAHAGEADWVRGSGSETASAADGNRITREARGDGQTPRSKRVLLLRRARNGEVFQGCLLGQLH